MSWSLFRWVWQLDGPMHVGMPPAGSLNRTRVYVPTRPLWGALTAELSRREALEGMVPRYEDVGESLRDDYRFTYLFPADKSGTRWKAWLPTYREGMGLAWCREEQPEAIVGDRQFRRRLLSTRPGTAINPSADFAEEGSLRETECINARWRDEQSQDAGPVAMVGYVFIRTAKAKDKYPPARRRLDGLDMIFIGGDTRYGMGQLQLVSFEPVKQGAGAFDASVVLDLDVPQINASLVCAHARADAGASVTGALEHLVGWDRGSLHSFDQAAPLWQPGSRSANPIKWSIEKDGTWSIVAPTTKGTL